MRTAEYIVSIEQGRRTRELVWNSKDPLSIQYPSRWWLVQNEKGIRLQEIHKGSSKPRRFSIPSDAINGQLINIPDSEGPRATRIRIRPLIRPKAVYAPDRTTASLGSWGRDDFTEMLFCGVANNLLAYRQVGSFFRIHVEGGLAFTHKKVRDAHEITSQLPGMAFEVSGHKPKYLPVGVPYAIQQGEWESGTLRWEKHWWRVACIPDATYLAERVEEAAEKDKAENASNFGVYAGVAGLLLTLALIFSPSMPTNEIKPKIVTRIELKAPKIVQALPTPVPTPKPKPKIAMKKPDPPKPKPKKIEPKPQPAKIAKKIQPAKPAPKIAAVPKITSPKPAPVKAPPPKVVSRPAPPLRVAERPAAPAPRPIERNVAPRPVAKATAPSLSAEQIAVKQAAQEAARTKAQLAQSLSFLSSSSSRPAAAMEADRIADDANQKMEAKFRGGTVTSSNITKTEGTYLNSLSNQGSAEGRRIVTRSARRISADEDAAYGGDGRTAGSGQVRGKVADSSLGSGAPSGVALGAGMGGGLDLSGSGEVSEIDIEKALEKSLARFQYCYEKVLLSDASLAGTILMEWTIDSAGRGSSVKVVRSQINSNPLHSCLSSELSHVQFPSPKGGVVVVKYPFAFSSGTL